MLGRWSVEIDAARFNKLKQEEGFWQLLALSRAVNALRFVHAALLGHESESDSPRGQRTQMNSFLFNCALLYEALLLVERLCKHYRNFPDFAALHSILKDPVATELRNYSLAPVRNRLTFHFDEDEMGAQLAKPDMKPTAFSYGDGEANVDAFYGLADICAMRSFSAFPFSKEGLNELMKRAETATQLSVRFMDAAEEFIVAVLRADGWQGREHGQNTDRNEQHPESDAVK